MSFLDGLLSFFQDGVPAADYGLRISKWCHTERSQALREISHFVRTSSSKQISNMEEAFDSVIQIEFRAERRQLLMYYFREFKNYVHEMQIEQERERNTSVYTINNDGQMNLTVQSTLNGVVQQISQQPYLADNHKAELSQLIDRLKLALNSLPGDKGDEAETIAEYAGQLVEEISSNNPKRLKVQITKDSLLQAAKNIAATAPTVLDIVNQIIKHPVFG